MQKHFLSISPHFSVLMVFQFFLLLILFQLILIYDASKAIDLLDLIKINRNDVHRIGFFDSVDPCNAKLICKTYEQFIKLPEEVAK